MKKRASKVLVYLLVLIVMLTGVFLFINQNTPKSRQFAIDDCKTINFPGVYILKKEITTNKTCFNITSNNVILEGGGHTLQSDKDVMGYGIYVSDKNNVKITNITIMGYEEGIYLNNTKNVVITDNNLYSDFQGIYAENVTNTEISFNNFSSSSNFGLFIDSGTNIQLNNNIFSENMYALNFVNTQNSSVESNSFSKNLRQLVKVYRDSSIISEGQATKFNFTLPYASDCPSCSYDIELYPSENMSSYQVQNVVYGQFTPTKKGIYSLRVHLIDGQNDSVSTRLVYLSSPTNESVQKYYLRGIDPTNGQAESWGSYHQDSGSLLSTAPLKNESRICADWIQFSPDELPENLMGVVKQINFSMRYIQNSSDAYLGVQRLASYDDITDYQKPISSTNGQEVTENASFDMSWPMNFFWSWYYLAIKLTTYHGVPRIDMIGNESQATIDYVYSSTPAIKEISNKGTMILSATMEDNSNNADLILSGKEITSISIQMPDASKEYYAVYNNISCINNPECSIANQQDGRVDLLLKIDGTSYLNITPTN